MSLQYQYIVAFVNSNYGNRFINSYTSLFATLIITGVALFAVLSRNVDYLSVDSAYLGLVLTWGFQISQLLSMAFVLAADLEQAMNAVIRVLQYIDNNPQEAEWNAPKAPEKWPVQADYDIKNISYKYRENLPHVINSISLQIAPREKIGVVGRTGAGKSTIALGLLRIIEISEGKDVSSQPPLPHPRLSPIKNLPWAYLIGRSLFLCTLEINRNPRSKPCAKEPAST